MRTEESKIHSSQENKCSECGKNIEYRPHSHGKTCSDECARTRRKRRYQIWIDSKKGKDAQRLYALKYHAKKYPDKYFQKLMDLLYIAEKLGWIERKNGEIEIRGVDDNKES